MPLPALSDFAKMICTTADRNAKEFTRPDDDFHPIMVVMPGEHPIPSIIGLPGLLLESPEGKDFMADKLMVPIIGILGGKMLAWTMSAWTLNFYNLSPDQLARESRRLREIQGRGGSISEHPLHQETVVVNVIDPFESQVWGAQITRTATTPPSLGEWNRLDRLPDGSKPDQETGRFLTPLQAALRDSSGEPNFKALKRLLYRMGMFGSDA